MKYVIYIVLGIVLLFSILSFAAGPFIHSYLNNNGEKLIGRKVSVESVSANLFTGALTIDSLFIYEPDGETEFFSFRQLNARLFVPRLLFGTYDFSRFEVNNLNVNIEQRDTIFNFTDIIRHLEGDEPDTTAFSLPLILSNLDIRNSTLRYQDLLVHSDFRISDFSLVIPGIDLRDVNTSVGASLQFVDGGQLQTQFKYDDRHRTYELDLNVENFNLEGILPYVRQQIAFGEMKGIMNLDMKMKGNSSHLLDFSLRGNAGIRGLEVFDPEGKPMVECDTVTIGVRDMDLKANRIELSQVFFNEPTLHIAYGADSLDNFSRLMVLANEQTEEAAMVEGENETEVSFNGKSKDLRLVIDRLDLRYASVYYRDESLQADPFVYTLSRMSLSAPAFSLDGVNHITASAKLGDKGRLDFRYDGRLSDYRNIKMKVAVDQVDVCDFSPYTVEMFGNEVSSGILSLNMLTETHDGQIYGENRIVVNNPKVEKKRHDVTPEMHIPFRTGVYILTDRDNVLDVEIPLRGNVDDPRFSYKRLIFRTLGKLIVKVCTSPFRRSSSEDVLSLDTRSLDEINLDSIPSDILKEE